MLTPSKRNKVTGSTYANAKLSGQGLQGFAFGSNKTINCLMTISVPVAGGQFGQAKFAVSSVKDSPGQCH